MKAPQELIERGVEVADRFALEALLPGARHVWRATDRKSGAAVAVKLVAPAGPIAHWWTQIDDIRHVDSPKVAKPIDAGAWGGWWYLACELIEGVTAEARAVGANEATRRAIAMDTIAAVAALHRARVVQVDVALDHVIYERGAQRAVVVGYGRTRGEPRRRRHTSANDVEALAIACHALVELRGGRLETAIDDCLTADTARFYPTAVELEAVARGGLGQRADRRLVRRETGAAVVAGMVLLGVLKLLF